MNRTHAYLFFFQNLTPNYNRGTYIEFKTINTYFNQFKQYSVVNKLFTNTAQPFLISYNQFVYHSIYDFWNFKYSFEF